MKRVAKQATNHTEYIVNKNADKQTADNIKTNYQRSPYNIGTIDRAIRYILGAVLVGSVFYLNPEYSFSLAGLEIKLYKIFPLIGIYPAITAWLGWDPIYQLARINSSTQLRRDVCGSLVKQAKVLAQE